MGYHEVGDGKTFVKRCRLVMKEEVIGVDFGEKIPLLVYQDVPISP